MKSIVLLTTFATLLSGCAASNQFVANEPEMEQTNQVKVTRPMPKPDFIPFMFVVHGDPKEFEKALKALPVDIRVEVIADCEYFGECWLSDVTNATY